MPLWMVQVLVAVIGNWAAVVVTAVAVSDDVVVHAVVAALDVVFVVLARIEYVEVIRVTLIISFRWTFACCVPWLL